MSVYLDHNATSPLRPAALQAMTNALAEVGNASSVHRYGRGARRRLEDAREAAAALIGCQPGDLMFTSGGTEANNTALRGHGRERTLVSAGEHEAVLQARADAEPVALQPDGTIDLDALEAALAADDRPALVSVMLANNETGAINPIAQVVEIARRHGARVHCDAVQAAGKIPVDAGALGVDLLTVSSHKLGGPQGAGALAVLDGRPVSPLLAGGGQERKQRAGTENVPAIAGFGAAAAAAQGDLDRLAGLAAWRDRLEAEARALCPQVQLHGAHAPRLPNTACLGLPGVRAETQVMALDLAGVAVSSGSACSSGKVHASHVLRAMGVGEADAGSAVRVSLGWDSAPGDVDAFLDAWAKLARKHGLAAAA